MISRVKKTKTLINYLKKKINCKNAVEFIDQSESSDMTEHNDNYGKMIINGLNVAHIKIKYDDVESDELTDDINRTEIKAIFDYFDTITEANNTGFQQFPYLYGVLDCRNVDNPSDSNLYVLFEHFHGDLIRLINEIEHPSEWYDIIFQIIMINYFLYDLNNYAYPNGTVRNLLYNKLEKPYYQDYEIDGNKLRVSHKYLIVMWNLGKRFVVDKDKFKTNIQYLLEYIVEHDKHIKIKPSLRIMNLLNQIINDHKETVKLLVEYYGDDENNKGKK